MEKSSWKHLRSAPRNKYGNTKVIVDGIKFDSKMEADYYSELKIRKRAGDILDFQLQPVFELLPAFTDSSGYKHRPITYRADFLVFKEGKTEIVDVKGFKTREFTMKWKMLQYAYREKGYLFTLVTSDYAS